MINRVVKVVALLLSSMFLLGRAHAAEDCIAQLDGLRATLRQAGETYYVSVVAKKAELDAAIATLAKVGDPAIAEQATALAKAKENANRAWIARERDADDPKLRAQYDVVLEAAGRNLSEAKKKLHALLDPKLPTGVTLRNNQVEIAQCFFEEKMFSTCALYNLIDGRTSIAILTKNATTGEQLTAAEITANGAPFAPTHFGVELEKAVRLQLSRSCRDQLVGKTPAAAPAKTLAKTPANDAVARVVAAQNQIKTQVLTFDVTTGTNASYKIEVRKKGDRVVIKSGPDTYLVTRDGAYGATSFIAGATVKLPLSARFRETAARLEDFLPRTFDGYEAALGKGDSDATYGVTLSQPGARIPKITLVVSKSRDLLHEAAWLEFRDKLVRSERRYYSCNPSGQCPLHQWVLTDVEPARSTTFVVTNKQLEVELPDALFTPEGFAR